MQLDCPALRIMITWSEWQCIRLFVKHGRTFSLASTFLPFRDFVDTAVMYALFRVVDDWVDDPVTSIQDKKQQVVSFERKFWLYWKEGNVAMVTEFAILPAVMEVVQRRNYDPELFRRFFSSMHADINGAIYHSRNDVLRYIDGSAAAIGELMLPILCGNDAALQERLRLHARALGIAFQLTNMIRDVVQDEGLGRVYLADLRDGDSVSVETYLHWAEEYYFTADVGIAFLPGDAHTVVQLARSMYADIHACIRRQHYRLRERAVVPWTRKLILAKQWLSWWQWIRLCASVVVCWRRWPLWW